MIPFLFLRLPPTHVAKRGLLISPPYQSLQWKTSHIDFVQMEKRLPQLGVFGVVDMRDILAMSVVVARSDSWYYSDSMGTGHITYFNVSLYSRELASVAIESICNALTQQ